MPARRDKTEAKQDVRACIVCVHAANSVSVNIDERTPLISSGSGRSSRSSAGGSTCSAAAAASAVRGYHRYQYGSIHGRHAPRHHQFSWLLVICLFLFFFTGIGIATYLLFNEGFDYIPEIYKFVGREEWNASLSNGQLYTIKIPADSVVLTDTRTDHCDNLNDCSHLIRAIQNESMFGDDLPDLRYNFMIDDTGTIYEGLGWHNTLTQFEGRPLVALIGDYARNAPSNDQIVSLDILLAFAVDRSVLTPCFQIDTDRNSASKPSLVGLAGLMQEEANKQCIA